MYLRSVHAESHIPTLRQFIKCNPLGTFTTAISSPEYPFLQTSHIPWVLDVEDDSSDTELGVLRGHMARQNPHAKAMMHSATSTTPEVTTGGVQLPNEVLVLFIGPVHHYVTPKFYTDTKPATGKVVPTWNYSAVQAYGKATVYFDSSTESTNYLSQQITDLSQHAETSVMGYTGEEKKGPWKVSDAPGPYITIMQKNIIGIKVEITKLGGKFKMSQEMGEKDRAGVIGGFESLGTEMGTEIARTIVERQDLMKKSRS
ncbi:transcriptional regulator PAI 2-type [Aspergillus novoparasiticus]|uniref:Transcriptional regulator PAI 2-type n=1 Tax=Aspergillus novoparasiticus TaxID=986946 RepID=A0A5N6F9E2_9EURO|nr:transcriptional regulator PAI 2-type [Aspergillus novoparasiticus]